MSFFVKTGLFSFDYEVPTGIAESGEFNVSLSYHSGYTGIVERAVTGISISNSGSGYYASPAVTVSGNGNNASFSVLVDELNGYATGVTLLDGGSGHSNPFYSLYQNVHDFEIYDAGDGYLAPPLITVETEIGDVFSGINTGDLVSATVSSGKIESINLYGGFIPTGYTHYPIVSIKECVSGVFIKNGGTGFFGDEPPVFSFSGGGGNYASGEGMMGLLVTGIEIIAQGSGYTGHSPEIYFRGNRLANSVDWRIPRASGLLNSGQFTGIHMFSWGGGWLEEPTIELESHEHHEPGLILPILKPMTTYTVTGFNMVSHGWGYDTSPSLYSHYGDIDVDVVMSQGAEIDAVLSSGLVLSFETGSYEKSFSGTWNLFTGSFNNEVEYVPISGGETGLTPELEGFLEKSLYTDFKYFNPTGVIVPTGLSVVPVGVSHKARFDNIESVALLSISGSGISPANIYITGKR